MKIEEHEVTQDDVGKAVTYRAPHAGAKPEDGYISSVRQERVFVKFDGSPNGKACPTDCLVWTSPPWSKELRAGVR